MQLGFLILVLLTISPIKDLKNIQMTKSEAAHLGIMVADGFSIPIATTGNSAFSQRDSSFSIY